MIRKAIHKALGAGMAIVLAVGMSVPVAFAETGDGKIAAGNLAEGLATSRVSVQASHVWTAPVSAVSENQIASDNVVTVGSHASATALPELLGLNGTTWATTQMNPTTLTEAQANDRLGVYGSDAGESANPYLANMFYNFTGSGTDDPSSAVVVKDTSSYTAEANFNIGTESAYGTSADLALRPDIVVGIENSTGNSRGITMNHETTSSINYATWGSGTKAPTQSYEFVLFIRSWTDDPSLAGTLNSDGNEYVLSEYYREGDNDYDPIGVRYATDSTAGLIGDVDKVAWAAKLAMQQDQAKTTRYDDPLAIAAKYEQYALATKWYVLSRISEKKTVAVVGSVTDDNRFMLVKLSPDGDSTGLGAYRAAAAVDDTVIDLAESALPNAQAGSMNSRSTVVDAATLMGADVIVGLPSFYSGYNASADDIRSALKANGVNESDMPLIVNNVIADGTFDSVSSFSSSVESAILVGYLQGLVYPEIINPVDMVTYYASELLHLKGSSLASFVKAELSEATLPSGVSLDGASYSATTVANVQGILDEGTSYYYAHKSEIDSQRPKIASSDLLDDVNEWGVHDVSVSAPAGAEVTVWDEHGLLVEPNGSVYKLDDDNSSLLCVDLAGYRTYYQPCKGTDSPISITENDLTPAKSVTVSMPSGATVTVRDSQNQLVSPESDGTYTLDADKAASYTVSLDGYEDYRGTISARATSVSVALSDMTLKAVATTFVIPTGAKLTVKDSSGKAVSAASSGVYNLYAKSKYAITVSLSGYAPYKTTIVGGERTTVTVRKNMLGRTAITLDKATVVASDVSAADAAVVTTIALGTKVKKISASTFKNCKNLKTLTVKSKKLTKAGVKGALKNSSVKTVKVAVGNASANKAYVAKYKKFFTKANCGKSVTVKK